jgi:hypothetical protein
VFKPLGLAVVLTRGVSGPPQALVVMEIIATAAAILCHFRGLVPRWTADTSTPATPILLAGAIVNEFRSTPVMHEPYGARTAHGFLCVTQKLVRIFAPLRH